MLDSNNETKLTLENRMQAFLELRESAKDNGLQDMTLDEINEEISKARRKDGCDYS